MTRAKTHLIGILRGMERFTGTDMVYLTSSGFWMNLGTVVISGLSLLLYIVFAHTLSKETYGTYQFLLSGAAIISALTLTGMNSAVARATAQGNDGTVRKAVAVQLRWSIVPFLAALLASLFYLSQENLLLSAGFLMIGFFSPIMGAFSVYAAFLQGKQDFRRGFWYGMGWNVPYYACLILAAYVAPSVLVLIFISLGVQAAGLAIAYYRTMRAYRPSKKVDGASIGYGKHLSLMGLGNVVATQIDTILAFMLLGPAAVAVYGFATAIPERLVGFFKFLPAAALPKFSRKSDSEMRSAFGKRLWIAAAGMASFAAAYAIAAPLLFSILFPQYVDSVPYTQAYAVIIIASISGLFTAALTSQANVKKLYLFNFLSPTLQLALQVVGILTFGLWGLIVSRVLASFLSLGLAAALVLRR
jgi:O-antigen/teichoic acid export membrane protein